MVTILMLVLAITTQDSSDRHVRSTEPKILTLIDARLSHSATFRRRVATLNDYDIVNIEPRHTRQALGGYLAHNIMPRGDYRDLHIPVEISGSQRPASLLAHELQQALELAPTPRARDAKRLEPRFNRIAIRYGCGGTTCHETQAAKNVDDIVGDGVESTRGLTLGSSLTRFCDARWRSSQGAHFAAVQHSTLQNGSVSQSCPIRWVGPFTSSPHVPHSQVSGHSSSTGSPAAMRATAEPPMIRVRSTGDTAVTTLLHDAFERSATFQQLVETINGTDGLVYVEPGTCGPGFHACLLMSVTLAGPNRVLHIRVDTHQNPLAVKSSMGHELQHAIEALSEPGVRTNRPDLCIL
jgi:hypothetical protein